MVKCSFIWYQMG